MAAPVEREARAVAQIWLTYEELAVLLDCDPAEARTAVSAIGLIRRRSRDGRTRAKLTPALVETFLDGVLRLHVEREVAACAGNLRLAHERMMRPRTAAGLRYANNG